MLIFIERDFFICDSVAKVPLLFYNWIIFDY